MGCCNNPFRFTVEASSNCTEEQGFDQVQVDLAHLDPLEIKHTVHDVPDGWYEMNYGSYDVIQKAIRNMFQSKISQIRMQSTDGSTTNPFSSLGDLIGRVVMMNTGQTCPR